MAGQSIENNDFINSDGNELVNLEVGQILRGRVSHVGGNYALIHVDNYDFILPKEEISWTKNTRIKDYIKLDEDIDVVVVRVEEDRAMVSLKRPLIHG
jgi:ribosomal protein S1